MKIKNFDDVINYTENYKNKIRGAEYDETVRGNTKESMEFLFINDKNESRKVLVEFELDFSFSFEDGFDYAKFSNFVVHYYGNYNEDFEYPDDIEEELELYIREEFVNTDRLSE